MENFYCSVGLIYQPLYGYSRTLITKVGSLMFMIYMALWMNLRYSRMPLRGMYKSYNTINPSKLS